MTDAPERIGIVSDGLGNWALAHRDEAAIAIQYVRADAPAQNVLDYPKVKAIKALNLALELFETGLVDFEKYGLESDDDIGKLYRAALTALDGK